MQDTPGRDTPVALITGANTGIGLEIAKGLAAHGYTVLVGSRKLEQGQAAAARIGAAARAVQLDVTDQASIDAAAARVRGEFGRLDVLVNNAGIAHAGRMAAEFPASGTTGLLTVVALDDLRAMFETNVFGAVAVTQAMLPLLREAAPPARVVNAGTTVGSLALNADPATPYRAMFGAYSASKTALHAVTLAFAIALESTGIKVNLACPGFVATALNDFHGTRTVEEGAREAVRLALLGPDGPTGTFSDENGPVPW